MNTPESLPNSEFPIQKWGNEIKKDIQQGKAAGSVTAHTNFRIENGQIHAEGGTDYNKGSGFLIVGQTSAKTEEKIYHFVGSINSFDNKFPHQTEDSTEYVTIVKPSEVPLHGSFNKIKTLMQEEIGADNSIVEIRYKQPNADESHRTSEKWIHLVVSDQKAQELHQMIEAGANPNEIHDVVADIFTTPETRAYFDATKIDPADNKTVLINPQTPNFEQTLLSDATQPGEIKRRTIHFENDVHWIEKASVEPINVNSEPPLNPEDDTKKNFSVAEPNIAASGTPPGEPPKPPATESVSKEPEDSRPDSIYRKELQDLLDVPEDDPNAIRDPKVRRIIQLAMNRGTNLPLLHRLIDTIDTQSLSDDPDTIINIEEANKVTDAIVDQIDRLEIKPSEGKAKPEGNLTQDQQLLQMLTLMGVNNAELAPTEIRAVFDRGRLSRVARSRWQESVKIFNITNSNERLEWAFENVGTFEGGTFPSYQVIKGTWLQNDLDYARTQLLNGRELTLELETGIKETKELLTSMIAVTAAASAMRISEGVPGGDGGYIPTVTFGLGADRTEEITDFILADQPDKLNKVIENEKIKPYYKQILIDAAITNVQEWGRKALDTTKPEKMTNIPSSFSPTDKQKAESGRLVKFLRDKAKAGGKEEYLKALLGEKYSIPVERAAASLAFDAFLVDKYTRWQYEIDKGDLSLQPVPNWKGDPFRTVIQPSFMPRVIKKSYPGHPEIFDAIDIAFHPTDILKGKLLYAAITPSAVSPLKPFERYNEALMAVLGNTSGDGIPEPKAEDMAKAVDNLVQVFGNIDGKLLGNTSTEVGLKEDLGKHIVGAMVARIIYAKLLAADKTTSHRTTTEFIINSHQPGRFHEAQKILWGTEHLKNGLIADWKHKKGIVLNEDNIYGARKQMKDAWDIVRIRKRV